MYPLSVVSDFMTFRRTETGLMNLRVVDGRVILNSCESEFESRLVSVVYSPSLNRYRVIEGIYLGHQPPDRSGGDVFEAVLVSFSRFESQTPTLKDLLQTGYKYRHLVCENGTYTEFSCPAGYVSLILLAWPGFVLVRRTIRRWRMT